MVKKVIGIGTMSIHLSYLVIIPILRQIKYYTIKGLDMREKRNLYPFITTGLMFVGMMIMGSLELISIYRQQTRRNQKTEEIGESFVNGEIVAKHKLSPDSRKNLAKGQSNKMMLFLICSAALLDYCCTIILSILTPMLQNTSARQILKPYQLLFTYFLCWYYLDYRLYRHHYVSIAIIVPSFLLITYQVYESFELLILVFVFSFLIQSLKNILEKYLIDIKSFSIYKIMFFEGLFGSVFSIAMIALFSFIKCPETLPYCERRTYFENPSRFFNSPPLEVLFIILIDVIYSSVTNLCYFLINKHFSPTHVVVSDVISTFFELITIVIAKKLYVVNTVLPSIGYAFLFIGCLIYNEIIIIYLCKMAYYTRKEISRRGDVDYRDLPGSILDSTVDEKEGKSKEDEIEDSLKHSIFEEERV